MKLRITLDVPDSLRHHIGATFTPTAAPHPLVTAKGLATRAVIGAYIQSRLTELDKLLGLLRGEVERPLTVVERSEAGMAVDYLRAQGQSDGQIRAWILAQHARLHFPAVRP